ncbi:heavy-metal-associated domain-containing protein [Ditylenchus destructor]|nr:heavy-metal-associated domain-containing protein [Ditylenchus destructor]
MSNKYTFGVEMTCEGCSNAVKRVLGRLGDKVSKVDIDLENKLVNVETELSKEEIYETLKKTGKTVSNTQ